MVLDVIPQTLLQLLIAPSAEATIARTAQLGNRRVRMVLVTVMKMIVSKGVVLWRPNVGSAVVSKNRGSSLLKAAGVVGAITVSPS